MGLIYNVRENAYLKQVLYYEPVFIQFSVSVVSYVKSANP